MPHGEEIITLKCPNTPLALGAPPRLSYPLVIFLTREFDADDHLHPNETVSEIRVERKKIQGNKTSHGNRNESEILFFSLSLCF